MGTNNNTYRKDDDMRYTQIINAWAETHGITESTVASVKEFCDWYETVPTKAQLKVMAEWEWKLNWFFNAHEEGYALNKVLLLKEPHYLAVYFNYGSDESIMRYIAVANEDACKTALKDNEACQRVLDRINKCKKERDKVYRYARWTAYDPKIDNAYRAAWYIVATDHGHGAVLGMDFSTKQLKEVMSRPEVIDRYAMIEYRDYSDILVYQASAINRSRRVIEALGGTMTVFKDSMELANEGCRMGNCIGTYWDHDTHSCLLAVDYKDTHMDVEIMVDSITDDTWFVSQVYTNNNTTTNITEEIYEALYAEFKHDDPDDDILPEDDLPFDDEPYVNERRIADEEEQYLQFGYDEWEDETIYDDGPEYLNMLCHQYGLPDVAIDHIIGRIEMHHGYDWRRLRRVYFRMYMLTDLVANAYMSGLDDDEVANMSEGDMIAYLANVQMPGERLLRLDTEVTYADSHGNLCSLVPGFYPAREDEAGNWVVNYHEDCTLYPEQNNYYVF